MEAAPTFDDLAERVRPVTLAGDRTVAVLPPLTMLLPHGLPRGTMVAVGARPGVAGATSLALMLAAGPSQDGAWVAVVGARSLGFAAAAELGVVLERLVVVDVGAGGVGCAAGSGGSDPQRSRGRSRGRNRGRGDGRPVHVAAVVAALIDGFDVVLVGREARANLHRGNTRRLIARVRERGAVLVGMGDDLPGGSAQVRMVVTASRWDGLEEAGHLQACRATVEVVGRGAASRPRQVELRFPNAAHPAALGHDLVLRSADAGLPRRGRSEHHCLA